MSKTCPAFCWLYSLVCTEVQATRPKAFISTESCRSSQLLRLHNSEGWNRTTECHALTVRRLNQRRLPRIKMPTQSNTNTNTNTNTYFFLPFSAFFSSLPVCSVVQTVQRHASGPCCLGIRFMARIPTPYRLS